ncbi:MAG: flagellar basal body rod protein FlgB [Candidatus Omnitrophica bacterium]|nr:flagellar basal body rod protein FlgB [Candidatus Omnitrophota bacterium]
MGDIFFDNQMLNILQQGLNGVSQRHRVLSNNIANADTPNFKRSDVDFYGTLSRIIQKESKTAPLYTTHPDHLAVSQPVMSPVFGIMQSFDTTQRADGNNVDIEKEIVEVNKNAILHDTLINFVSSEFSGLRYAIQEGR